MFRAFSNLPQERSWGVRIGESMLLSLYKKWLLRKLKKRGLQIADDCRLMAWPNCFGSEPYLVSVGKRVTIASRVQFITHDGGTWVFRDRSEFKDNIKYGRITVHDDCFIGFGACILPSVSIGPGSVVGARAVVSRNVPPGEVWAGVPARRICNVEEYAARSAAQTPPYDADAYRKDKRTELLRLFPYRW